MPPDLSGKAVAHSVNIQDFAVLGYGVGTADVYLGGICFRSGIGCTVFPVPEYFVVLTEPVIKPDLINRFGPAYADARSANLPAEIVHCILSRCKEGHLKPAQFQIVDCLIRIHRSFLLFL